MRINQFEGIKEYHDGSDVCDFVNMIPLHDSAIDRLGEAYAYKFEGDGWSDTDVLRGFFQASNGWTYVAKGQRLWACRKNEYGEFEQRAYVRNEIAPTTTNYVFRRIAGQVTFAESSTKPSTLYVCDGSYIYYLKPDDEECVMHTLWSPNMDVTQENWDSDSDYDKWLTANDNPIWVRDAIGKASKVSSICWFDNRLVACDTENNTVWLTATNPEQFIVDIDRHNPFSTDDYQLWQNYVTTNNNSDVLQDVASFGGHLYLLNRNTMEVWNRTGEEFNPIQSATNSTIYHGGRCPRIINGVLFVIASDENGSEYLAVVNGTNFEKTSNNEMCKRLADGVKDLQVIHMRNSTHIYVRTKDDEGYCYSKEGLWWHWKDFSHCGDNVAGCVGQFVVTNYGHIAEFKEDSRKHLDGCLIERFITGCFAHYAGRKMFRCVELVCDTGVAYSLDGGTDVFVKVSNDRGYSYGIRKVRKMGEVGNNKKRLCFRALGQGFSYLLTYGTSADYRFQVYTIDVINE